jgi:asparagine synthase (glutamine-hydrolysing)
MCGIAGIFNPKEILSEEAPVACARMARAMAYRGPDEEGFFSDKHAELGHKRLSIIDLSSGQQPMRSMRRNHVVVFNGEIYNFQELRAGLEADGYTFRTRSDTEVLLVGYEKWGDLVVEKLRGMFAFALYDAEKRRLLAARDPIGKKPFYYHMTAEGTLYFASDLQALTASGILQGRLSAEAIQLYFAFGFIPAPFCIYRGVNKLQSAEALAYSTENFRTWRYWDINLDAIAETDERALLFRLEQLLDQAVARRLIADVPLGALLSGGIDSNLIVSAMAKTSKTTVRTYTAGFTDGTGLAGTRDERELAASATQYYGTTHEEICIDGNVGELLPALLPYLGEPLADSSILPTYLVCKAARSRLTVALTGDGGDEPFGGYSFRYLPHLMEQRIRTFLPAGILSPIAHLLASVWPSNSSLPQFLRCQTIFRNLAASPLEAFFMDLVTTNKASACLLPEVRTGRQSALDIVADLYRRAINRDELTRILYVDARLYMVEDVLVKSDRMSMANSLELRAPLLDQEIISFAFSLPPFLKIQHGETKYILRRLAGDRIMPLLLKQPKTGFSIPVETYLKREWKRDFEETVLAPRGLLGEHIDFVETGKAWNAFLRGDIHQARFLWICYMLGLWFREFHGRQLFRS